MSAIRVSVILSLSLSACTGGAGGSLVKLKTEQGGVNCTSGGTRIEAGLDANGNGTLEPGEVTDTQFVCSGAAGVPGGPGGEGPIGAMGSTAAPVLVQLVPELAGANCAQGGKRVLAGPDTNGNGVLDQSEVSATSYVCDGAQGAPGPGITWVSVTGTAQQAAANTGYLANNPSARVVVTLPVGPAVGDIVQVTGVGAGGFSIAQNAGQLIDARNLGVAPGAKWTERSGASGFPTNPLWMSVASSSDGAKLALLESRGVFTSTDSGASWTAHGAAAGLPINFQEYSLVASSADGTKLVVTELPGVVWISANGGISWAAPGAASGLPANANWRFAAISADGRTTVLAPVGGQLWTSTDEGQTWVSHGGGTSGLPATAIWNAVASSADGTRLAAAAQGSSIYRSTDSGATWASTLGLPTGENWRSLASSSDGERLVVVSTQGQVWTWAGGTWTARDSIRRWRSVASSADGSHLVAVSDGLSVPIGGSFFSPPDDHIYTSTDFGATWTARESRRSWRGVASAADGNRLVAITETQVFISSLETTPGTTGSITGGSGDAVTLQHVGGGKFVVLNASGSGFSIQ